MFFKKSFENNFHSIRNLAKEKKQKQKTEIDEEVKINRIIFNMVIEESKYNVALNDIIFVQLSLHLR